MIKSGKGEMRQFSRTPLILKEYFSSIWVCIPSKDFILVVETLRYRAGIHCWLISNITMKAIVLSAVCFKCSCCYEIVNLGQRMPHYNSVPSLLSLSLIGLEELLRDGALNCSDSLVSGSKEDLVTELSTWLFGHVAPCLHDLVTKHIILVSTLFITRATSTNAKL